MKRVESGMCHAFSSFHQSHNLKNSSIAVLWAIKNDNFGGSIYITSLFSPSDINRNKEKLCEFLTQLQSALTWVSL